MRLGKYPPAFAAAGLAALALASAPAPAADASAGAAASAPAPGTSAAASSTVGSGAAMSLEACVADHELAQRERRERRLRAAREALQRCRATECPGLVRAECEAWLQEVDAVMPSVIVSARGPDGDLTDVRLSIDGVAVADELTGAAIELDPGPHEVVLEREGFEPVRRSVVLAEGDQRRLVTAEFLPPPDDGPPTETSAPAEAPTHRPMSPWTWALGGSAVAATAVSVAFGVAALGEKSALERSPSEGGCAPLCTDDEKAELEALALTSDVALAVAIGSAAGALVTHLVRPRVPLEARAKRAPRPWLTAGPRGGMLGVSGDF